jgi:hypothetical protein
MMGSVYGAKYDEYYTQLYADKCIYEIAKRRIHPSKGAWFLKQSVVSSTEIHMQMASHWRDSIEALKLSEALNQEQRKYAAMKSSEVAKRYEREDQHMSTLVQMEGITLDAQLQGALRAAGVSTGQVSGVIAGAAAGAAGGPGGVLIGMAIGFFSGLVAEEVVDLLQGLFKKVSREDRIRMFNMRLFLDAIDAREGGW